MGDFVVVENCLLQGFELHHISHWSEEFVLYDFSVMRYSNYGWLNEISFLLEDIATDENLSSLFLNCCDTFFKTFDRVLSVERSNQDTLFKRVAQLNSLISSDHALYKFVVDRLVQKDSSHSGASLACGSNTCEHTCL